MPHDAHGNYIAQSDAVAAWAAAARPVLVATAQTYRATITYNDLAADIQPAAGIWTKQLLQHWIGKVLGAVSDAQPADEPALTPLVLDGNHNLGTGYADAIARRTGTPLAVVDQEDHAAAERLACYRYFGADVPADATPEVSPALAAARRAAALEAARAPTFHCGMKVPATGVCELCGAGG